MKTKLFKGLVLIATLLTLIGGFTLTACANNKKDWEYLQKKGTLTIGITDFAPMNYKDGSGKWVGFDTEFAEALCAKLGLKVDFKEIEWGSKELELNGKNIDAVWNGLTWNEDRAQNMDMTQKYLKNKGVLVCKAGSQYATKTDALGNSVKLSVELGSAAEKTVDESALTKNANITRVDTGVKSLMEVYSGAADVTYCDLLQAQSLIADGGDFSGLVIGSMEVETEFSAYAIGLRKNSPVTLEKFNKAIDELFEDGTMAKIATKYLNDTTMLFK